jgi:hypothetical protein
LLKGGDIRQMKAASQTLSLAAKSLQSLRGIEKNILVKKFFESIIYSINSIQINLFYPLARGKIQPKNSGAKIKTPVPKARVFRI